MGQRVGKAKFIPAARPFLNANAQVMEMLWNNFNEIAEGFGVNESEFVKIFDVEGLRTTSSDSRTLFRAFDTDNNNMVDALEVLTTLAFTSGLTHSDKVKYMFRCYDFDESQQLTLDEMTLSFKSALTGLAKLCNEECVDTLELEALSQQAFTKAEKNFDNTITAHEYLDYCLTNPEVRSWIYFFDDPEEHLDPDLEYLNDPDIRLEMRVPARDAAVEAARNPDTSAPAPDAAALASRPWLAIVKNMAPTNPPPVIKSPFGRTMTLEWVYGYRAQDARNNVRYLTNGEIAYHAASVGIVYNPETHTQRYNMDHSDEVLSMAVHPNRQIVATGEAGAHPKIVVWDSAASNAGHMDAIRILHGYHTVGVSHLSFSPNGNYLASVGTDTNHCVAVYDWNTGQKVFSEQSTQETVLATVWRDDNTLVTCGINHIFFWDIPTRRRFRGLFGRGGGIKPQALLSLCVVNGGEAVASGTASGHIYIWQGRNCVKAIKAHESNTAALYSCPEGIVSGGRDGKVRVWTHAMVARQVFDIATFGSLDSSVRSVCWEAREHKMLVGTMASEVYEINSNDGENMHSGPLIQGHYRGELWGLSVHPVKPEFATVGDDGVLRVWDATLRRQIRSVALQTKARAVAYSPDGSQIAVGYGAEQPPEAPKDRATGGFEVFNTFDFSTLHKARDSRQWISDIKYSPNGAILGVASRDNKIYLYSTEDFTPIGTCSKHSSFITHFDFDSKATFVQSNSGNHELHFYDAHTGEQQVAAPAMKDVEWSTWTCPLGWSVQGIWPAPSFSDGTEYSAVCRSFDRAALVTADEFGRLRMWRFPIITDDYIFGSYTGHAPHITNVRWLANDTHIVSVGGLDRCALQWRVVPEVEDSTSELKVDLDSDEEQLVADGKVLERPPEQERVNNTDVGGILDYISSKSDEFMAVKPWVASAIPPTVPPPENTSVPDHELTLKWVHGFRAADVHGNVAYAGEGEIVYTAAKLCISLHVKKWNQRFITAHTDEVICLAVHPDGIHVATGQLGARPSVAVWRMDTMQPVCMLKGYHKRGVSHVAFSGDGKLLATAGLDDDHSVAVYDWRNQVLKAVSKGEKTKSLALAVSPDGKTVVQAGLKFIRFHSLNGRTMCSKPAVLGKKGRLQPFLCVVYSDGAPIVGSADGNMYQFKGRQLQLAVQAHQTAVYAMHACAKGVVSGGKDGAIKLWSTDLAPIADFSVKPLGALRPSVQSVCWDPANGKILVGTISSEIFEISERNGQSLHDGALIQGHFKHELWGVATHPTKQQYVTVGDDGMLRVWDAASARCVAKRSLDCLARAVAYSPDGTLLAVGLGGDIGRGKQKDSGKFLLLRSTDLEVVHSFKASTSGRWVSDIKFTPDGRSLGVATHDNHVYLYDVNAETGEFPPRVKFDRHNAPVTHFDFSADSRFMQSNCAGFEHLFCDVATGVAIRAASSMKDVEWSTYNCVLGWPMKGIWPAVSDGTDITSCSRSANGKTLATADEFGRVRLRRFPCLKETAGIKEYRGHSAHVTNVRWTAGDQGLISVGGKDRLVFQWTASLDEQEGKVSYDAAEDNAAPAATGLMEDVLEYRKVRFEGAGDPNMAAKPWVSTMVEPSRPPAYNPAKPAAELKLEWAYGFRAQDTRSNVRYNSTGQLVYTTAGVGVIYDKVNHSQRHYLGHGEDIVCLAVDRTGTIVATGQQGSRPEIHLWDAQSGIHLCTLPFLHPRAVIALAFSPDGYNLFSVGNDEHHCVGVWRSPSGRWTDGVLQATAPGVPEKVLFAGFSNSIPGLAVTGGQEHMCFWTLKDQSVTFKHGVFGRRSKTVLCMANVRDRIVTGTLSGHIYFWDGVNIAKSTPVHESAVVALYEHSSGLISASKTGQVRWWSHDMEMVASVELTTAKPAPLCPVLQSVCMNRDGSLIVVGTQGAEIYEISVVSKKFRLLVEGHWNEELWGLAAHPTSSKLVATSGDDASVRIWDIADHRVVSRAVLESRARALAWSPDGSLLAIGLGGQVASGAPSKKDGGLVVLRVDTMEVVHYSRESKKWISDIKFSPDGSVLAVSSMDSKIYLYDARGGRFTHKATCGKNTSYITHVDFSLDAALLQCTDGGFDMLYYNVANGEQLTSASTLRDATWATWTCDLGWPVQGLSALQEQNVPITSVDRSNSSAWVATADDRGRVRVFNWPCLTQEAQAISATGHWSHVMNVRWTHNDAHLLTVGGKDRALLQWMVLKHA